MRCGLWLGSAGNGVVMSPSGMVQTAKHVPWHELLNFNCSPLPELSTNACATPTTVAVGPVVGDNRGQCQMGKFESCILHV